MDLTITSTVSGGRHVLQLTGALDLASRDGLLKAGADALATPGITELVLNTAGVDFLDSTGIGAIVQLAGDASDGGADFVMQAPSDRVARVLEVSGLRDAWKTEPADAG